MLKKQIDDYTKWNISPKNNKWINYRPENKVRSKKSMK